MHGKLTSTCLVVIACVLGVSGAVAGPLSGEGSARPFVKSVASGEGVESIFAARPEQMAAIKSSQGPSGPVDELLALRSDARIEAPSLGAYAMAPTAQARFAAPPAETPVVKAAYGDADKSAADSGASGTMTVVMLIVGSAGLGMLGIGSRGGKSRRSH